MTRAVVVGRLVAVSDCGGVLAGRCWTLRARRCQALGRSRRIHGHTAGSPSRTYVSWLAMLNRCTRENAAGWRWYGLRHVQVTPEWRHFTKFLRDMGERPVGKTLDRIDPDDHYRPGNCRWATWPEQVAHRRPRGSGSSPALPPPWLVEGSGGVSGSHDHISPGGPSPQDGAQGIVFGTLTTLNEENDV